MVDWAKSAFGVMVAMNFADCSRDVVCKDGLTSIVKLYEKVCCDPDRDVVIA